MSTQADLYASREDGRYGVYVVMVFEPGQDCELVKEITVTAMDTLSVDEYPAKVLIMFSWFLAPTVLFFTLLIIERVRHQGFAINEPELQTNNQMATDSTNIQVYDDHDNDVGH